jgi:hypothetical protein
MDQSDSSGVELKKKETLKRQFINRIMENKV